MSTASQFLGGDRIATSVVNSAGEQPDVATAAVSANCATALSGALTAATLKQMLSVTGRGQVNWVGVWRLDTTVRTISLKVTVDGNVVYNVTSGSASTSDRGLIGVGAAGSAASLGVGAVYQPLRYNQSLKVEIASSLTETDKLAAGWNYEVHR